MVNKLKRQIKLNNKGMAILLALSSMAIMLILAVSVSYDTQVEYQVAAQKVNRLKAHYAAKAGVEISLFRILIYKKAVAALGDNLQKAPALQGLINMIWQFPFSWPPVVTDDMNAVAKDKIQSTVKESFMDSQYATTIEGEGGKIDINDLGSPVKEIAEGTYKSVLQIFAVEVENNRSFSDKYRSERFEELVNNLADWVDEDNEGRNRGSEDQLYEQPRDSQIKLPPNRAFRTLEELRMAAGMNDDFFNLLKDRVTVYGTKGINPNNASELVLKGLDPQINDEVVGKIIARRSNPEKGGPFRDSEDFFSFISTLGVNTKGIQGLKIPLYFDAEYNFRIISVGKQANILNEIQAITFDVDNLSQRYADYLKTINDTNHETGKAKVKFSTPKGRPTVVYWQEN